MARRPRRQTFWLGFARDLTIAGPDPGNGASESSEVGWATDETPHDEDSVPTLVRIRGNLIITAGRADVLTIQTTTQEALWSWGMMCQHSSAVELRDPDNVEHLGDERWMYTKHGVITGLVHGNPVWNTLTDTVQVLGTGTVSQLSPYPQQFDVDIAAQRKFQDPCILTVHLSVFTPSTLENFTSITARFLGRALFKAT